MRSTTNNMFVVLVQSVVEKSSDFHKGIEPAASRSLPGDQIKLTN